LSDCYITATIRCAPPQNKPLPEEIENCRPYFLKELDLLEKIKVIVPLGQIAFTQTLKSLRLTGFNTPSLSFGHGKIYSLRTPNSQFLTLITTYHPSQQNTQTGKLTRPMFHQIFEMVRKKLWVISDQLSVISFQWSDVRWKTLSFELSTLLIWGSHFRYALCSMRYAIF